jgi:hypothetical protein
MRKGRAINSRFHKRSMIKSLLKAEWASLMTIKTRRMRTEKVKN